MAKTSWTRDSAIEYLAERKLLTKSPDQYTTPYLKRLAGAARNAEQEGKGFTRKEARGHARATVRHQERDTKAHKLEQYSIKAEPGQELDIKDLKNLVNKTKGKRDDLLLVIRGVVESSDPNQAGKPAQQETYTTSMRHADIRKWLKDNPKGDVLQFAYDAFGLVWESVSLIGFAYPQYGT